MTSILATEAKRSFGGILRNVERGESYTIMRRGKPVARIVPFGAPVAGEQFGALSDYASDEKRSQEDAAFRLAAEEKHALR